MLASLPRWRPPVVEELTYRGVLLRSLRRRMSVRATILVSSAAFATLHVFSAGFNHGW